MVEYRNTSDDTVVVERRGGAGRVIAALIGLAVLIAVVLFATGFWSANVTKSGSLPNVDISTKGGSLPKVDVDSKKVVVGTSKTTVDVPTVKTEKKAIDVPAIGVSDGDTDKK